MRFSIPLRSREPRLPVYQNIQSSTKERYSNDGYYSSDGDSESSISGPSSSHSSRNVSESLPNRSLILPKKKKHAAPQKPGGLYPYRLPPRVIRYAVIAVVGLIVLMILSLIRASQLENWRVANGQGNNRPPPPPLWEKFPFLSRYYGGIRTLLPSKDNKPEYPRPGEPAAFHPETDASQAVNKSKEFPASNSWDSLPGRSREADIKECFLDAAGTIRPPPLRYYNGRPSGFPQHVIGSYEALKLPEDICFERYGRFGPYGFGYSARTGGLGTGENGEKGGSESVWTSTSRVDYRDIDWAAVQRRCFNTNADRFKPVPAKTPTPGGFYVGDQNPATLQSRDVKGNNTAEAPSEPEKPDNKKGNVAEKPKSGAGKAETGKVETGKVETGKVETGKVETDKANKKVEKKGRTAVIMRCWDEYLWREDDLANLRSMISELSLASGGRYDIHLLVQVKNDAKHPIWADHEIYEQRIRDTIPKEFQGLVTLWSETQMLSLYQGIYDLYTRGPDLPVHGVYRGLIMAMQHFAYMHPEYDYFWHWEMDVRYTGHYHDLLSKLEGWAKNQPRKGLWERNSRFYFPSVHGSWEDFSHMARVQTEMGSVGSDNVWEKMPGADGKPRKTAPRVEKAVWGPVRPADETDWFEPESDPVPPTAFEADHNVWGVGEEADLISLNPIFDPEGTTWLLQDDITGYASEKPPRRASIITTSRMSRRLLMTMHRMTAHKKQFAFPEMWPATAALQHGYKAVYAPHPIYVDRNWPLDYMSQTFNGGRAGSTGGSRTGPFGEREHNLRGLTWYYNSGFGPNLYRRWLGLKVNNDGGEEFETTEDMSKDGSGVSGMLGGEGRMCLPPMLLHPVKEVELPIEAPPQEEQEKAQEVPESDPAA